MISPRVTTPWMGCYTITKVIPKLTLPVHVPIYLGRAEPAQGSCPDRSIQNPTIMPPAKHKVVNSSVTGHEIKIAKYWPTSCFFGCLWTETELRSINTQNMNQANI